jgi:phosphatidylserine decarboxylase
VRKPVYSAFASWVGADVSEVELPLEDYPSIGSFFTRKLRPGVRPVMGDDAAVVAPCDGAVAAVGRCESGTLVQAKGHDYLLSELLADRDLAERLEGGDYVTIYLSPSDYHRVHAPMNLQVRGYRFIPGRLLPVNPTFAEAVPNLFTRNERVVFDLDTEMGPAALVMVGATGVGNISVTYAGAGAEPVETRVLRGSEHVHRHDHHAPVSVARGEELGMFHLGSTVVLVVKGIRRLAVEGVDSLRVGQVIGRVAEAQP